MANSIIELHLEIPADLEGNVFGQFDEHLKLIERTLNVTLISVSYTHLVRWQQ